MFSFQALAFGSSACMRPSQTKIRVAFIERNKPQKTFKGETQKNHNGRSFAISKASSCFLDSLNLLPKAQSPIKKLCPLKATASPL